MHFSQSLFITNSTNSLLPLVISNSSVLVNVIQVCVKLTMIRDRDELGLVLKIVKGKALFYSYMCLLSAGVVASTQHTIGVSSDNRKSKNTPPPPIAVFESVDHVFLRAHVCVVLCVKRLHQKVL